MRTLTLKKNGRGIEVEDVEGVIVREEGHRVKGNGNRKRAAMLTLLSLCLSDLVLGVWL